jgi:hypothetical protein
VSAALRQRGVGDPQATLVADAGMTVLRIALEQWAGGKDDRELDDVMHDTMSNLRVVTADRGALSCRRTWWSNLLADGAIGLARQPHT